MLDHRGRPTTFGIEVDKPFSGELARGLNNNLGLPKTASEDMFSATVLLFRSVDLR